MQAILDFFRCDARPGLKTKLLLGLIPFVIAVLIYSDKSADRRVENPKDKSMPSLVQIGQGFKKAMTDKDREGENILVKDMAASGKRVAIALGFISLGLFVGLYMGCFPFLDGLLYPFIIVVKFFIPATLISVLFGFVGAGETAKIILMVLSLFPLLVLEARKSARELPREQLHKTWSLGATDLEFANRVVLPQILPKMKDFMRLNLHVVVTLLVVGESFGASAGMGYRILVNQRNINMADVIPYVVIMAVFMWTADKIMVFWISRARWFKA